MVRFDITDAAVDAELAAIRAAHPEVAARFGPRGGAPGQDCHAGGV